MPKPQRPIYLLRLRPLPRVDGIQALRRGLKLLLRQCGLRCLEVKLETSNGEIKWHEHRNRYSPNSKNMADRDRAQKPARAVATAKPTLPAQLDHRSPHERYLDEVRAERHRRPARQV